MESKILIDIDPNGQPRIKINYRLTEDLRDELVGRFLYKMGILDDRPGFWAYCRLREQGNNGATATVVIEPLDETILSTHVPQIEAVFGGRERMTETEVLNIVDKLCVDALPHDVYKKWKDTMFKEPVSLSSQPIQ